ncbi:hypothetical protein PGT21_025175 [Puccinia graminis f. sp. tritici]|uniref:Uncharacterized protein n=1 Tax=Puccinia graminis f. sp. tritici TaxID=56615 RepID=A0A5B0Q6D8_PUCGR|nr:hypothetical protein PGT21_025175 [Puccinia graminis f. sp. tritici]
MHSRWKICQCTELGCNQETYRDSETGEEKMGKAWSVTSFKSHLKVLSQRKQTDEKEREVQANPQNTNTLKMQGLRRPTVLKD